eukprot:TRINITY_DN645_c0_g6_i1.p1 TRINITY_DN645_c0_g6~~TRINITY_DN645_c0_g6_i1.p1  ORF type:complete len:428 (+),score=105.86 TRINITY_DN645_c0_g6_i1:145-1284(+)
MAVPNLIRPLPQTETKKEVAVQVAEDEDEVEGNGVGKEDEKVGNGTAIPMPYASFLGKNKNGTVIYSGLASINSSIGGNVTTLYNSTIPGFIPSAVTVDPTSGAVFRLGTNNTNLCDNEAPNYVEIYNGTVSYIALNGDSDAAHANQYMDVFYNPRVGLLYASVYNTAPNCSFGNLTSAIVTIDPYTGVSKVEVSFPVGLLITSPGRTVFNFNTLFAYAIFNDYTTPPYSGDPVLYAIDLQGLKAIPVTCPTVNLIYQISFNTITNAIVYLGNSTEGTGLTIGKMTVSQDGNSAAMNETVPLKWLPETCSGIGFHRGAFDPKSGYYAIVCGGTKPEDFPTQVVTFNIRGGNHYSAFIRYPVIQGFFSNLASSLVYMLPY